MESSSSEDLIVNLQFTYQYDDLLKAYMRPRRWGRQKWTVLVIVLMVIIFFGIISDSDHWARQTFSERLWAVFLWVLIFGLVTGVGAVRHVIRRRKSVRRLIGVWVSKYGAMTCSVTMSSAGVSYGVANRTLHKSWQEYHNHFETTDGFYLCAESQRLVLIPKRAATLDQQLILRELLRRHASRSLGFPVGPALAKQSGDLAVPEN